jgi:hypothetical protein
MDLRGAPLPEGTNAARKHTADEASASKTPPAEAQLLPTLCTRRDPAIPQPPAAEAAGGGEESRGSAAARWEQTGGAQIASLFLRERGTGPRVSSAKKVPVTYQCLDQRGNYLYNFKHDLPIEGNWERIIRLLVNTTSNAGWFHTLTVL